MEVPSPEPEPVIIVEAIPINEDVQILLDKISKLEEYVKNQQHENKMLIEKNNKLKLENNWYEDKYGRPKAVEYNHLIKDNITINWTIIEGCTAFSDDPGCFFIEPCREGSHPTCSNIETIKILCDQSKGYGGFVVAGGGINGWVRSQVKTPNELIMNVTPPASRPGASVYIRPGASVNLLRNKEKEGYKVTYNHHF